MDDGPTADVLDLTSLLLEADGVDEFLQALVDRALERSPAADGSGITLERRGRPLTVANAGPSAKELDEKQYGQDDGPCLQALRAGEEVIIADMADERRWGDYPAYALACGTRSSMSLPIAAHTHTAGALNLYFATPDGHTKVDAPFLRGLAAQATGAIALAQRIGDAQQFAADLQTALASRTVIDQAIGVIMGQQRCTADEAFAILRTASQHRNIKLRDLCADLLAGLSGEPPTEPKLHPRP
ncbi:GAF and ANTAR domain-containing protein [Streptomyces ficellus]|uniref:GAF and ANTAR domain-containing protein n=1 Tax=Streptomyces ficellus TaxID=1977088 RepID=A0ABT7Z3E0_9ACTN|nr:GAF and ANTAR domain-containing protein [Streptomyces ficellus]MDN3294006.1 GAF and ANTAR domain-containing protein [Streptomyces ficellus]